jgi:hypothetical protein
MSLGSLRRGSRLQVRRVRDANDVWPMAKPDRPGDHPPGIPSSVIMIRTLEAPPAVN